MSPVKHKVSLGTAASLFALFMATQSCAQSASLGYDYSLSKRTDVLAVYLSDKNSNVANGNSFAVGMRHTF